MGQVTELTIAKCKTVKLPDKEVWMRTEYNLKIAIDSNDELQTAKAYLEGVVDGWLNAALPSTTSDPSTPRVPSATPKDALEIFPKNLADLLIAEERSDFIVFKPKAYLGSDNFAKIASVIRDEGGEYVSAGKDSHFRISTAKIGKQ